jgi:hypothetical protein
MVAEIWHIDIHSQRKFTERYTGQRNAAFVEHDAKSSQNLQQAIEKKKAGWTELDQPATKDVHEMLAGKSKVQDIISYSRKIYEKLSGFPAGNSFKQMP